MGGRIAQLLTLTCLALTAPVGLAHAQSHKDPPADAQADSLGADWGPQQDEAREGVRQGRFVPLSKVIAQIERRTRGRTLDAGLEQAGGRPVYRVRWAASDGRRIDYIVDAQTGAILSPN